MHPQGIEQDENYRNSVTRLSTALTMAEPTYTGRLRSGVASSTPQKAGPAAATVAGGEGVK